MSTSLVPRELFGGAILLPVPADYIDASDLRQVPDNQEVFLSNNSDTSLIVEILAMVEEGPAKKDLWEAAKFHFHSLANDNAALSSTILTPNPSAPAELASSPQTSKPFLTPQPVIIAGTQTIHKFSHDPTGAPRPGHEVDAPDIVWIAVALWRCWIEVEGTVKKADIVCSVNVNLGTSDEEARAKVEAWWVEAVGGLKVEDWNLFGDE